MFSFSLRDIFFFSCSSTAANTIRTSNVYISINMLCFFFVSTFSLVFLHLCVSFFFYPFYHLIWWPRWRVILVVRQCFEWRHFFFCSSTVIDASCCIAFSSVPSVIVLQTVSVIRQCLMVFALIVFFSSHFKILILVELQNITNLYLSGRTILKRYYKGIRSRMLNMCMWKTVKWRNCMLHLELYTNIKT